MLKVNMGSERKETSTRSHRGRLPTHATHDGAENIIYLHICIFTDPGDIASLANAPCSIYSPAQFIYPEHDA